jgi:hypothetical protein
MLCLLKTTRSLLNTNSTALDARLEASIVYSRQFSNTTVDIIIFDSNSTNATFSVAEAAATIE